MTKTTRIRRNGDILAAAVGDETILLDPATWTYVSFNETAARIWDALDQPQAPVEIVEKLMNSYDVDRETCNRELAEFVHEMSGRGLILVEAAS